VAIVVVGAVAVVVMLVPITFRVPLLGVFIPPAMAVFPAPFPRSNECPAFLSCLWTVPAVFLSGSVQLVIDADDSLLAVLLIGARVWRTEQQNRTYQGGPDEQRLSGQ